MKNRLHNLRDSGLDGPSYMKDAIPRNLQEMSQFGSELFGSSQKKCEYCSGTGIVGAFLKNLCFKCNGKGTI